LTKDLLKFKTEDPPKELQPQLFLIKKRTVPYPGVKGKKQKQFNEDLALVSSNIKDPKNKGIVSLSHEHHPLLGGPTLGTQIDSILTHVTTAPFQPP
jgi:hypothetical protein